MATKKKTDKQKPKAKPAKKAAPKKVRKPSEAKEAKAPAPRHPKARVIAIHTSKEALAKAIATVVAREDEDTDIIANRLETASNSQLLRLQHVVETVKQKYGSREKLIAAIGSAQNKSKDKDYLARLDSFSLPQLLDLATSGERRARA